MTKEQPTGITPVAHTCSGSLPKQHSQGEQCQEE